jgi:hypothetical protein
MTALESALAPEAELFYCGWIFVTSVLVTIRIIKPKTYNEPAA